VRFVVDQCVPAEVARWLASEDHEAWTAFEAGLGDAADEDLIAYAHAKGATLVTTNRDCAQRGRRLRSATVIWLAVREQDATIAMGRASEWLRGHTPAAGSCAPGAKDRGAHNPRPPPSSVTHELEAEENASNRRVSARLSAAYGVRFFSGPDSEKRV
jgi:predicted nuclease of predicted toxin-antitoxin system